MGYERIWNTETLLLYLVIAFLIAIIFRKSIQLKNKKVVLKIRNVNFKAYKVLYIIVFFILFVFLCFRLVQGEIGGTDTKNYIEMFENVEFNMNDIINMFTLKGEEPIFMLLLYIINLVTNDYHILFFVIYSIIIASYIYFIDKTIDKVESWPFIILIILPILQSMNIIRNSMAIAISLVAFIKLKEDKKILSALLFFIAFGIHYTSLIMIGFYVLYIIISKIKNRSAKIDFIAVSGIIIIGILATDIVKNILSTTTYSAYIGESNSVLGFIQVYILFILSLFLYKILMTRLKKENKLIFYDALLYNVIILTISIKIGAASRTNLYFDMIRVIMWIEVYSTFLNMKFVNKKEKDILIFLVTMIVLIGWIIFRIYKIWYGYGIMPYYNELFLI